MSDHDTDRAPDPGAPLPPELRAAVDALRHRPAGAPGAVERATAAALAAQRAAVAAPPRRGAATAPLGRRAAAWAAAAAVAVGLGGAALWRARGAPGGEATVASAPAASAGRGAAPAMPPAGGAGALDEAPRLVRFTLRAPSARRVAVVGDFNRWDPAATPLAADAGVWAVEVPLTPGRHAYAFVVDGRRWVLDPAAPRERDPDFGRSHSVTVVGVEAAP
jgi:hypothetical protein